MNKIYKLIWSKIKERWILVSEKVAARSCPSGIVGAITLAAFLSCSAAAFALDPGALPTGGKITAGTGSISTTGRQMTVNQSSNKMIANWETFNIGKRAGVTFRQPDADSTALNRISDQNPSQILGTLSANGKIFLVNPSGIVFGKNAQVNVGGLVASSLNILDDDFMAGKYKFYNTGYADDAGKIINQGNIKTEPGGVVALIAPKVINEGTITSESGSVVLAAGNQVSLDFKGDGLISYTVDQGAVDALAENKGLLKADGGFVVMTAKAANSLTGAVVNHSGIIEAQTLQNKEGRILLLSDMENGRTIVSGKLDASAPYGGSGGFIETSAHDVKLNDSATVTTNAPQGSTGTWLIDPTDFIVGTDISGAALSANLNNGNIILETDPAGAGNGDIFVNEAVSWSSNNTLTLEAYRHINVNTNITATGDAAGLVLTPDTGGGGGSYFLNNNAVITLSGLAPGLTIDGNVYTVINEANGGIAALQNMNNNLSGYYALGSNISAAATSKWNAGFGFVPIGNTTTAFTGQFDGLGHTITKLTINRPTEENIGLFGWNNGTVMNVSLVKGKILGSDNVGALAGLNSGTIDNASSATQVTGGTVVGGLVGLNAGGVITDSYATGSVTGIGAIGGGVILAMDLDHDGDIDLTSTINSGSVVGGLVGLNDSGTIDDSSASGSVTGGSMLGGLIGLNNGGQINNSSASGNVAGVSGVGDATFTLNTGIVADLDLDGSSDVTGNISGNGTVSGGTIVGGLVGFNIGGTIDETTASGKVSGGSVLGGLVGFNEGGQITNSSASGSVTGKSGMGDVTFSMTADFDGAATYSGDERFEGSIDGSVTIAGTGTISGGSIVGGLVGFNAGGSIDGTSASGNVTGGNILGGLVGLNFDSPFDKVTGGRITSSSASGSIIGKKGLGDMAFSMEMALDGIMSAAMDMNLNGTNDSTGSIDGITNISATGSIKGGNMLGGLVGLNAGGSIDGSSAIGSVTGGNILGGLVGLNLDIPLDGVAGGQITNSSATGSVTGKTGLGDMAMSMDVNLDGVIAFATDINFDGINDVTGNIDGLSSISGTGSIKGGNILGGLVGLNSGGAIDGTSASGSVTGGNILGGLVGLNLDVPFDEFTGGQILNSSATGIVTGKKGLGDMGLAMNVNLDGIITFFADANLDGSVDMAGIINGLSNISGSGSIKGGNILGGLVGLNAGGTIDETDALGSVTGGNILGGLVGLNLDIPFDGVAGGKITNSSAWGSVTGKRGLGDMAASMNADFDADVIFDDVNYITGYLSGSGSIKGGNILGGLVGLNTGGTINGNTASGNVTGGNILGGLVGLNLDIPFDGVSGGEISGSDAFGSVTGTKGLGDMAFSAAAYLDADLNFDDFEYATFNIDGICNFTGEGSIKGGNIVGGLVGLNTGGTIDSSSAVGNVTGGSILGGLVGFNLDIPFDGVAGGQITNSSASGSVTGTSGTGDMAFSMDATVNGEFDFSADANFDGMTDFTGSFDGASVISGEGSIKGGNIVGGLVGLNTGSTIDGSSASGNVSGGNFLGGLVGFNLDISCDDLIGGKITNSSASGSVTGTSGVGDIAFAMDASINGAVAYSMDINFDGIEDFANNFDLTGFTSNTKFNVTGNVKGGNVIGGLVGLNAGGIIDGSTSSGNVTGRSILGSLIGLDYGGQISNSLGTGIVTGNYYQGAITFADSISVRGLTIYESVISIDGGDYVGGQIGLDYGL